MLRQDAMLRVSTATNDDYGGNKDTDNNIDEQCRDTMPRVFTTKITKAVQLRAFRISDNLRDLNTNRISSMPFPFCPQDINLNN
jgi:hypothetical protein